MDTSLAVTNAVAESSLGKVSSSLMSLVASSVLHALDKHLQAALQDSDRIRTFINHEVPPDVPKTSEAFLALANRRMWAMCSSLRPQSPIIAIWIAAGEYSSALVISKQYNADLAGFEGKELTNIYLKPGFGVYAAIEPVSGLPIIGVNGSPTIPWKTGTADLEFIELARSGLIDMSETVFPTVSQIGSFLGYGITSRYPDTSGSAAQVESAVFFGLKEIKALLSEVTSSATAVENGVMRAFTCIASTWLARRGRERDPESNWQADEQAGTLTGVSHGESDEAYFGVDNMFLFERVIYRTRADVNATDDYIRAVAVAVDGSYESFSRKPRALEVMVDHNISGEIQQIKETHFVSCDRLTYPQHGLDWWITVSIDAESVLRDVRVEREVVQQEIALEKQVVVVDIQHQAVLSRSIIGGIAVGLVVLSAVTSFIILRPIKALQQKMELVAGMQLDNMETESTSTFYELRRMQRDFRKMVHNLLEFRAYVPSSVLESNGYSGEGGCQVVEPPTGKVAIVFTDIKGSTNLWKLSPGDMNVAMEVHNEVIREACVEHSGYEVKTIGDSFMVSFSCPVEAARFALDVQTKLAKRVWPSGLELPPAGLVVRIGVNYGSTISESNPVTGRVDYRGSTVNMAARVESKARGGTVCITSDMLAAVKRDLPSVGTPVVTPHGAHELKGLGTGHQLYSVVPQGFDHRLNDSETDCRECDDTFEPPSPDVGHSTSSGSDMHRGSTGGVPNAKVQNKTQVQLVRGSVTVAVCRLLDMDESKLFNACNVMIRAVSDAAVASDGVVGSVTGRTMTIVWNASKRCKMHRNAALTCTAQLEKRTSSVMRIGVATGMMLHGNVGTQKSRFSTTFGLALEVAEAVADHSIAMGCFSLYADCSTERFGVEDASLQGSVRLIDAWMDEREKRVLRIFQVMSETVLSQAESWGGGLAEDDMSQQNEAQSTLVSEILTADGSTYVPKVERLRMLANEKADAVLQNVVTIFSDIPAPTKGYRCTVSFTRVPKQAAFR
eukprot:TRINITY_DN1089_c0_g1_i12.p1 TRINITY_DN1089_c0_g1~~TRINITY_DN1089_c0_g1_i12.p1  ORF type:complete len:1116 (+),score=364.35 TRINITY_DN1089_c0_g1_i12:313-3348(+)